MANAGFCAVGPPTATVAGLLSHHRAGSRAPPTAPQLVRFSLFFILSATFSISAGGLIRDEERGKHSCPRPLSIPLLFDENNTFIQPDRGHRRRVPLPPVRLLLRITEQSLLGR